MSTVQKRLLAGFGANGFSRFVTTLIQIVSVPIFLTHWGTPIYGEWILLNTIPTYLSLSDMGFGSVAGNEMTMLVARGQITEALAVFQSVWVLTAAITSGLAAMVVGGIWWIPLDRWLHIHYLPAKDVRLIAVFLGVSVLCSMQEVLFAAAYRCVGKYPFGTLVKSLVSLTSFFAVSTGVILGASPRTAAMVFMLANACGTAFLWLLLQRSIPWIRFGATFARWELIRQLTSPAISFMSFPISNAVGIQGTLVVVAQVLGPLAVVTFSTARTISRSALQAMALVNNAVLPEISAAFGSGDIDLARRLHRRSCQVSIGLCALVILAAATAGARAWKIWTVDKVGTDSVLLHILLAQMAIAAFWYTSSVVQIAINKHQRLAGVVLASSVGTLALTWALMKIPGLQLRGAAIALGIGELVNAFYVLRSSLNLVEDTLPAFLVSFVRLPSLRGIRPVAGRLASDCPQTTFCDPQLQAAGTVSLTTRRDPGTR